MKDDRSKRAYRHNGLIGSAAMMQAQARKIKSESSTSQYAKELCSKIEHMAKSLEEDLRNNRIL